MTNRKDIVTIRFKDGSKKTTSDLSGTIKLDHSTIGNC